MRCNWSRIRAATLVALTVAACGGDPSGPSRTELAGTYTLTELLFDPQGSLMEVDVLARFEDGPPPRLVLAASGAAQLVFVDPGTGFTTITNGSWSSPSNGARIYFGDSTEHRQILLPRRMTFTTTGTTVLSFSGESPGGVSRSRLVELVPEWADEQLLDPVPGDLSVTFTRS